MPFTYWHRARTGSGYAQPERACLTLTKKYSHSPHLNVRRATPCNPAPSVFRSTICIFFALSNTEMGCIIFYYIFCTRYSAPRLKKLRLRCSIGYRVYAEYYFLYARPNLPILVSSLCTAQPDIIKILINDIAAIFFHLTFPPLNTNDTL